MAFLARDDDSIATLFVVTSLLVGMVIVIATSFVVTSLFVMMCSALCGPGGAFCA